MFLLLSLTLHFGKPINDMNPMDAMCDKVLDNTLQVFVFQTKYWRMLLGVCQ